MYVKDLLEIFAEEYDCEVIEIGASQTEKFHEKMVGDFETCIQAGTIKPLYEGDEPADIFTIKPYDTIEENISRQYFVSNNKDLLVTKEELKQILVSLDLLEVK
jgi:hypothetical protein